MRPLSFSAKSLVSAKGRVVFALARISWVNFEGALPFGWKCPLAGAAGCAIAGLSPIAQEPATEKAAPAAGRV